MTQRARLMSWQCTKAEGSCRLGTACQARFDLGSLSFLESKEVAPPPDALVVTTSWVCSSVWPVKQLAMDQPWNKLWHMWVEGFKLHLECTWSAPGVHHGSNGTVTFSITETACGAACAGRGHCTCGCCFFSLSVSVCYDLSGKIHYGDLGEGMTETGHNSGE